MLIIIKLVLVFLAGMLDGEMDVIKDYNYGLKTDPLFKNDWYRKRTQYLGNTKLTKWLIRYPFSFLMNGWHCVKYLMVALMCVAVMLQGSFNYFDTAILFVLFGMGHNIMYHKTKLWA